MVLGEAFDQRFLHEPEVLLGKVSLLLDYEFINVGLRNVELSFFVRLRRSFIHKAPRVEGVRLLQLELEVYDLLLQLSYLLVVLLEVADPVFPLGYYSVESVLGALEKENFDVRCLQLRLHIAQTPTEVVLLLRNSLFQHGDLL